MKGVSKEGTLSFIRNYINRTVNSVIVDVPGKRNYLLASTLIYKPALKKNLVNETISSREEEKNIDDILNIPNSGKDTVYDILARVAIHSGTTDVYIKEVNGKSLVNIEQIIGIVNEKILDIFYIHFIIEVLNSFIKQESYEQDSFIKWKHPRFKVVLP